MFDGPGRARLSLRQNAALQERAKRRHNVPRTGRQVHDPGRARALQGTPSDEVRGSSASSAVPPCRARPRVRDAIQERISGADQSREHRHHDGVVDNRNHAEMRRRTRWRTHRRVDRCRRPTRDARPCPGRGHGSRVAVRRVVASSSRLLRTPERTSPACRTWMVIYAKLGSEAVAQHRDVDGKSTTIRESNRRALPTVTSTG